MSEADKNAESSRLKHVPAMQKNLDAAERVLLEEKRALHAKDLAKLIIERRLAKLSGRTPWKTITARISIDILENGEASRFQRVGHDLFGLRIWGQVSDFAVKRRRINPIDENILVLPRERFLGLIRVSDNTILRAGDIRQIVSESLAMKRAEAEATTEFVQLIPTFLVRKGEQILCYKRTKRLPESRLHHSWCVSFGGHLQSVDEPELFLEDERVYRQFIYRELYEELKFTTEVSPVYLGILYLENNDFEKQHAGIIFDVPLPQSAMFQSLEPGMHSDVKMVDLPTLLEGAEELDSWSRTLLKVAADEL